MVRIPSQADVAALSRDDWEDLCRTLVAVIYGAEGVEDRHGKGNGLDMIRIDPDGARGWQFRRFDGRFDNAQAAKVFTAIELAARRCEQEDKANLVEFTLWANIDLEPGHKKSIGERERFSRLRAKAKHDLGVEVRFVGITEVRAQLLMNPALRPSLFEDVPAQIAAIKQELTDEIKPLLKTLAANPARTSDVVKRLVEQATVHFERGQAHGAQVQFQAASRCFRDALNLIKDMSADHLLEGRVLLALAGVEAIMGNLPEAEVMARRSLHVLTGPDAGTITQARAILALVLQEQQDVMAHSVGHRSDPNELSAVVELVFGTTRVVLGSDLPAAAWDTVLRGRTHLGDNLLCEIPHHGSAFRAAL